MTNLDEQIDQILEYIDQECVGVDVFSGRHGFNYDTAKAAIRQLLVAERIATATELREKIYEFMHVLSATMNNKQAVSNINYEFENYLAALQSQLTDGESAWLAPK